MNRCHRPLFLAVALAGALFSLPLYPASLGGLNDGYTPPLTPKPTSKAVPKPKSTPKPYVPAEEPAPQPASIPARAPTPAPVAADDPAIACWRDGAWQADCAFAAYPGGPQFRIVGGDLSFTMGTRQGSDAMAFDDEHPPHPVRFQRRFALAETEVSVAHYLACVQDGGCREPQWRETGSQYHYQTGSEKAYYLAWHAHQPTSPITGIDWNDARAYAAWLTKKTRQSYALPTEAQWEYAARGNKSARWYFGNDESRLKEEAWYGANSGYRLHAVGSTPRNSHPWGLKDMAGNAWEWVADCWHGNYQNPPDNGDRAWEGENGGECGLRVIRGGSWRYSAWLTRAADRVRNSTVDRDDDVSFRPARMLP